MKRFKKKRIYNHQRSSAKYAFEKEICSKYGLKNKKQLARVTYTVHRYKVLFLNYAEQHKSVVYAKERLKKAGITKLDVYSFLDRRLQTIVQKKFNITPYEARQLISYGRIKFKGVKCRYPSYLVYPSFEHTIEKINSNTQSNVR